MLPGITWAAWLRPGGEGACSDPPRVGRGWCPYQREVVVAGVVAGVLTFQAEALWAQCQAGPPAPAQAEPGGQTGELTGGGQFLRGSWTPTCCSEGAGAPKPPPYPTGVGRGHPTGTMQEVALPPSLPNVPFFCAPASPRPATSPGASNALRGFLGAHGSGGGAGWRPCKGRGLSVAGL